MGTLSAVAVLIEVVILVSASMASCLVIVSVVLGACLEMIQANISQSVLSQFRKVSGISGLVSGEVPGRLSCRPHMLWSDVVSSLMVQVMIFWVMDLDVRVRSIVEGVWSERRGKKVGRPGVLCSVSSCFSNHAVNVVPALLHCRFFSMPKADQFGWWLLRSPLRMQGWDGVNERSVSVKGSVPLGK